MLGQALVHGNSATHHRAVYRHVSLQSLAKMQYHTPTSGMHPPRATNNVNLTGNIQHPTTSHILVWAANINNQQQGDKKPYTVVRHQPHTLRKDVSPPNTNPPHSITHL
ncbi:Hypothetical predicted protein [Pelobates cultripes]|uniref:Uncharacterized protein n=1 Tax=Pelobates cultripes TaxID=61616 RepID=A0AAD1RMZ4_PELCU|nr:Hypothetical predicted protein [Pelobates cultripes]